MEKKYYDIGIIGAGASGCIAAAFAKEKNSSLSIAVLEKNENIMKKVVASGNGRCNILNSECENIEMLTEFFQKLGIYIVTEDEGRMYPRTQYSKTVKDKFEKALKKAGVDIFLNTEALEIEKGKWFSVKTSNGDFLFKKLLIASGGKAGPQFGTTGDSFRFLRKLSHTVTTLRPALTAIECEGDFKSVKGIRAKAKVWLLKDEKPVCKPQTGEVQFTNDGLSGICIMNLSRYLILDKGIPMKEAYGRYCIKADFAYDMEDSLFNGLNEEEKKEVYEGIVRKPLCYMVNDIRNVKFKVTGSKGWKEAQVTAGGLLTDEIDEKTMQSKLIDNLYISGEALDYDGPCGGFNLYNAWYTGIKAGRAMADVQD